MSEMPKIGDVLFRAHVDNEDYYQRGNIYFSRHEVLSITTCGYWVRDMSHPLNKKRFVWAKSRSKYVCPTEREAVESLLMRSRRFKVISESRVELAERNATPKHPKRLPSNADKLPTNWGYS